MNPSNQQVILTIIVYGQDGAPIGSAQLVLAARSKQAAMLRNLPGLAAMAGKRGWAAFSVPNGALGVLGLRFGGEAFTTIPVTHRSVTAPAPMTSALPQLAFGGGWYSALYFSNTTGRAVSFQANFIGNKGTPLNVPPFGTSQTINLNPGATAILEALNAGPLVTGWAEATLPAGVIGHAVFRQTVAGRADQEAVVLLTPESSPTAGMIYDDTSVFATAAAFLNPGNQPVLVTIAVYGGDGAQIGLIQLPLQPRAKPGRDTEEPARSGGHGGQTRPDHFFGAECSGFRSRHTIRATSFYFHSGEPLVPMDVLSRKPETERACHWRMRIRINRNVIPGEPAAFALRVDMVARYMPKELKSGILYVSEEFDIAMHLCACGCGSKVKTPLGPTEWSVEEMSSGPSLWPSVGNWQQPCQSHYWIEGGDIIWAEKWTPKQIAAGRHQEEAHRRAYYDALYPKRGRRLRTFWCWIVRLFIK